MTQKGNFFIYSSSAGSGKTFTLTREYIILIIQNPNPFFFKNILAVTFTNDAANEMKKRVLDALKAFSELNLITDNHKEWLLLKQIKERTLLSDEIIQARSKKIFRIIIQEYSDFAIRTIDSFTNQIVSSFTEELDLPFNFEIELELNTVLADATDRLLEKVGIEDNEELSESFELLADFQVDEGKPIFSLNKDLIEIGRDINNDQFYPFISQNEDLSLKNYREIYKKTSEFINETNQYISELVNLAIVLIKDLEKDDFSSKGNPFTFFNELKSDSTNLFSDKIFSNAQLKTFESGKLFGTKSNKRQEIEIISNELILLFEKLKNLKNDLNDKYIILNLINKKILNMSLIGEIQKEFKSILTQNNQVSIGEFNKQILKIILEEPVPFIYERIGEKFEHLLIDEFQDTSNLQFFNLLPLIENSVSKGNMNLIVGDAKQSIYRWRGGNISLIIHLFNQEIKDLSEKFKLKDFQIEQLEAIKIQIQPENLQQNYRSTEEIIDFNNDFFSFMIENKKNEFPFFAKAYQSYNQLHSPKTKKGGGVKLTFSKKSENDIDVKNEILSSIKEALEKKYELKDIAILTRKNKFLSEIASFLIQNDIPVISKDSLLLKNSSVANFIITFLKVIQSPDKQSFKNELLFIYENNILENKFSNSLKNQFKLSLIENDNELFFKNFEEIGVQIEWFNLVRMGLTDLVESIILKFDLYDLTNEIPFIFELQDIIARFANTKSNHILDFLEHWEAKKSSLSISSSKLQNAVTIMSIHGSKGLEFPIVIIRFANWALNKNHKNSFWADLNSIETEELTITGTSKKLSATNLTFKKELAETSLSAAYNEEVESEFLEGLNMAYVAFTRAINHLHIICLQNGNNVWGDIGKSIIEFTESKGLSIKNLENYTLSEYADNTKIKKEVVIDPKNQIEIEEIISSDLASKLRLKRTSDKLYDVEGFDDKKEWGMKIHAAFERIKTKKDVDDAIQRILFDGMIQEKEVNKIKDSILQVIDNKELKGLFDDNIEVINERDILQKNREIERPDRVVLIKEQTYIIDYKTGEEREYYGNQIKKYGQKYAQMGYKNISLLLVYLGENSKIIKIE